MLNFENLDKANFLGIGKYDAPIIQPEHIDVRHLEWIPFNFAKTCTDCATKGVRAALERLEPGEILWYGKCPEEFDWNVTRILPYYKQVRRRCENGR